MSHSLSVFVCWWRHNQLLADDATVTRQLWREHVQSDIYITRWTSIFNVYEDTHPRPNISKYLSVKGTHGNKCVFSCWYIWFLKMWTLNQALRRCHSDIRRWIYVTMVLAEALAPNKHQATSNHQDYGTVKFVPLPLCTHPIAVEPIVMAAFHPITQFS